MSNNKMENSLTLRQEQDMTSSIIFPLNYAAIEIGPTDKNSRRWNTKLTKEYAAKLKKKCTTCNSLLERELANYN